MEKHARLGPSNHRWPVCPGSVREEAKYPDIAGEAAIDGTGSHLLLELCLQHGVRAEMYDGQIIGANHFEQPMGWMVGPDRIARVQECLDYVSRRVSELKFEYPDMITTVMAESKSYPGHQFGRDDWWGTVDITIAVTDANGLLQFIEVCDYKDGRGWVNCNDNTQLLSYMGGKLHKGANPHRPIPVRMCIVQPKTNPSVRYVDTDSLAVAPAIEALGKAAALTDDPEAPLVSGKHCQWCKHKVACTAETKQSMEVIAPMTNQVTEGGKLFEMIGQTFIGIESMTSEALAEMADARAGIMAAFDKVEAEIQRRIESGVPVDGYAMQPGRSSNVWNEDDEVIEKMLKGRKFKLADIYPPKLISPAQVLKSELLTTEQKEKISKQYISNVSGALKLTKVRGQSSVAVDKLAIFADVVTAEVSFL